MEIHNNVCPRNADSTGAQISCDGVKECHSTSVSLDVYSLKMNNCKCIYPTRIIRPLNKYKGIDNDQQLKLFLEDVFENEINILQYIADSIKRSNAKKSLGHASYFPCEYCFAKGVPTPAKSKNGKNVTRVTWPASTCNGEPRTQEKIQDIIDNFDELRPEERKGILGQSLLTDIPNFDIVRDVPAEYLHSTCLGVTKRMCELTFNVGEARPRTTNRKLSDPSDFNALMTLIKSPREFPRRARDLDFSVFKGAEFRNLSLFYFPLILQCIEEGHDERELWLYWGYMIRSCVIPSPEFRYVDLADLKERCNIFYKLYEKTFGPLNCTYNTHVVLAHLIEIRAHGPLTETSSFIFESFYGEMKTCFVPDTISPLKQIFQKIMLKRNLSKHCCEIPIYYSDHETSLENDTLIYVWAHNDHNIYHIKELLNQEELLCNKITKEKVVFEEANTLEWHKVGVYKKGEILTEQDIIIRKEDVSGKVIEVLDLYMTCSNNILREK